MKRIVLEPHAGGLGDMLLYSTLPKMYAEAGYTVFVSTNTPARNNETQELIWNSNPYVKGFVSEPGGIGAKAIHDGSFYRMIRTHRNLSPVLAMEAAHIGFNRYREIHNNEDLPFVQPRVPTAGFEEFSELVVCDPFSISQPFSKAQFEEFYNWVWSWDISVRKYEPVCLVSPNSGNHGTDCLPSLRKIHVKSISDYRGIIAAAKRFLVTESGGQSLAASHRPTARKTISLVTTKSWNDRCFIHPEIQYYVTRAQGAQSDF